jgi:AraC family transcriptional regulator
MRDEMLDRWRERIGRAASLLGANLLEPPKLDVLASCAAISPYHFHRMWRALTGRTVGETVRHLRVEQAKKALLESNRPITDIALSVGFATPQSFARAFRQEIGVSPSAYRLGERNSEAAHAVAPTSTAKPMPAIELVFQPSRTLIAKRRTGLPYEDLNEEFGVVWRWAQGAGFIDKLKGIYGVPYDDPLSQPVEGLRYDAGLELDNVTTAPAYLHVLTLRGGEFARLRVRGSYAQLEAASQSLIGAWLAQSGREPADAPMFHHFHNDPDTVAEAALVTDIYLPLEPREGQKT